MSATAPITPAEANLSETAILDHQHAISQSLTNQLSQPKPAKLDRNPGRFGRCLFNTLYGGRSIRRIQE